MILPPLVESWRKEEDMRAWLHKTGVVALAAVGLAAAMAIPADASTQTVQTGGSFELHIPGNPSTGYTWRLNQAKSQNIGVVKVKALGYGAPESNRLGAPAPFGFRIECTKPGSASLWFLYVGPTGQPGKEREQKVQCE
jgi:predicted secreted protein